MYAKSLEIIFSSEIIIIIYQCNGQCFIVFKIFFGILPLQTGNVHSWSQTEDIVFSWYAS